MGSCFVFVLLQNLDGIVSEGKMKNKKTREGVLLLLCTWLWLYLVKQTTKHRDEDGKGDKIIWIT